jgi:hypothetical protein
MGGGSVNKRRADVFPEKAVGGNNLKKIDRKPSKNFEMLLKGRG